LSNVALLGADSTSHQPAVPISAGVRSDVRKRPSVGTSHRIPMNASRR
jgi:hypothetical protein